MSTKPWVSISVIRRLPRYYRHLGELLDNGTLRISSRELADRMGLTASQIRQDLNCFGGFGQQGYGYHVMSLRTEIARILGLDSGKKTIQIGLGNLGRALISHLDFTACGFSLVGLFEKSNAIVGSTFKDHTVRHIDDLVQFCIVQKPTVAILCVPKESAKQLVKLLIAHDISVFWNFSDYDLSLQYPNIQVENVHLSDSLMTLGYLSMQQP